MSELDVFNHLKKTFPNAEIDSGDWIPEVIFTVSLADFCNFYKKDMSSVKYEAQTGEYWQSRAMVGSI